MESCYRERKEMQECLLTISVDFKLTNHQVSSIWKNRNIHVTSICGDTFMACDSHWFPTSNGASWMGVEYLLLWKVSWRHIARYSSPYQKVVKGNTVWKRYFFNKVINNFIHNLFSSIESWSNDIAHIGFVVMNEFVWSEFVRHLSIQIYYQEMIFSNLKTIVWFVNSTVLTPATMVIILM